MNKPTHKDIYYWLLVIYACSVVWSKFMMSAMPVFLVIHWAFSGNWQEKLKTLKTRKSIWFTSGLFLLYAVGLLYTDNMANGWKLTSFLLPSFAGALVVGTQESLSSTQIKRLFYLFIVSLSATAIFNLYRFSVLLPEGTDIRKMSKFMSHIRYSLFINVGIFAGLYFLFRKKINRYEFTFLVIAILWLIVFLFLLQSFTGIFLFLLIGIGVFINRLISKIRLIYALVLCFCMFLPLVYVGYIVQSEYVLYKTKNPLPTHLPTHTKLNNAYQHDTLDILSENGNILGVFMCEQELPEAWNRRSKIDYEGFDFRNQYLKNTLKRYLTSKGLAKDAEGVAALTEDDIENVESGFTNYRYTDELSLRSRVHSTFWQLDIYKITGNSDNSSIPQRIDFFRCALAVFIDNFWFGVGTGDGVGTMKHYYAKIGSHLGEEHQHDSHNQYLNCLVALGIIGFLIVVILLGATIWYERCWQKYLFIIFFAILALSMLVEDTMNELAGGTFFGLFWTIFVFAIPSPQKLRKKNDLKD